MSKAPLQLTLSVCSSVCTPLAVLYMTIVIVYNNDSLLFLGNATKRLVFDIGQIHSVFFSLKSSVYCLNTIDIIFATMDDDRPCLKFG